MYRLRPGTHYAPVLGGVYFATTTAAFVMRGPDTLHQVVDRIVPLLEEGADPDGLTAALGTEAARSTVDRLLGTWRSKGMLLDLDVLTEDAPGPAERARYAETLAHLETRSADPYADFARLRGGHVVLLGAGPAAEAAVSGLTRLGVGAVRRGGETAGDGERLAMVRVEDEVHGEPCASPAADRTGAGGPLVRVTVTDRATMVSTACSPRQHDLLCERAGRWSSALDAAPPHPVAAALAGALAGHLVLDHHTAGVRRTPCAHVIHGPTADAERLSLPADPDPGALAEVDGQWKDTVVVPEGEEAGRAGHGTPQDVPDPARLLARTAAWTAPWTGLAAWREDDDLAQLPTACALIEPRAARTADACLGGGRTPDAAALEAMLKFLRAEVGATTAPAPGAVAAAAADDRRLLLDAALRAQPLVAGPVRTVPWAEPVDLEARRLWRVLADYYGVDPHIEIRDCAELGWCVATVRPHPGGPLLAAQWGDTPITALVEALRQALTYRQFAESHGRVDVPPPSGAAGTGVLQHLPGHRLSSLYEAVRSRAACRGMRVRARLWTGDFLAGPLNVSAGWVWWA
ncbi:hypothetical protein ABZ746_38245 [Streptomyces sp. NPDC020096]